MATTEINDDFYPIFVFGASAHYFLVWALMAEIQNAPKILEHDPFFHGLQYTVPSLTPTRGNLKTPVDGRRIKESVHARTKTSLRAWG